MGITEEERETCVKPRDCEILMERRICKVKVRRDFLLFAFCTFPYPLKFQLPMQIRPRPLRVEGMYKSEGVQPRDFGSHSANTLRAGDEAYLMH